MRSKLTKQTDRQTWNLEGLEVTYLHLDYRFAFDCWEANSQLTVIIATQFELRYTDHRVICNPADVNSVKEAIAILHKSLKSLSAFSDGRLLVTFVDGTEISVAKDLQYEAWQARGQEELKDLALLCTSHAGPPWKE